MRSDVGESLRRWVAERAAYRCEYCLLHEDDSYSPHQIDHVISRKHGGTSEPGNLAYACLRCNAWKGSDVATIDPGARRFVRLFHPRLHRWEDHFVLRGAVIEALTDEGKATARLLRLNLDKRAANPTAAGRYPR